MKRLLVLFLGTIACASVVAQTAAAAPETTTAAPRAIASPSRTSRTALPATRHMIVAAEPDAAQAGLEMLKAGGSAVDAAIAAQMVLTLVEPQSSGIGGGSYLVISDGTALHAYDGREIAPASAKPGMFLDANGHARGHEE